MDSSWSRFDSCRPICSERRVVEFAGPERDQPVGRFVTIFSIGIAVMPGQRTAKTSEHKVKKVERAAILEKGVPTLANERTQVGVKGGGGAVGRKAWSVECAAVL